jgi:hypothetical protein
MRKLFTSVVVVLTITWAVGLAAFVPTAQAVSLSSGDLIKGSLPAVYYYGADAKRYVFPDVKTYETWYGSDFSSVKTITDTELATIPIGGNVTYRPGESMIKIQSDPKVYAVSQNGTLHWVSTEAVASCLYGSDWSTKINDVSDAFFVNYTIGDEITDCADYDPDAAKAASPTINVDKGLAEGAAGDITASLAADNPTGATLPINATNVKVLKFNLSGTGTVNSLTFKSEGVGDPDDIANAYLYEGSERLTSGKSLNSTTKEAVFNTSLSLNNSRTLSLVIDVAGAAVPGDIHTFKLLAINGEAVGGVTGNTFEIGSQAVSNVTIQETTVPSNPQVGEKGAEIANFKLTGGVNDAVVNSITLTQFGSINAEDLTNFVLKHAGEEVASAESISSGDRIVLVFNTPFSLLSGAVKNFTLYADVAGRPGRTISVYVDTDTDVNVIDSLYGFGTTVTNTFAAGDMEITTEGGEITIAFNGPITGDFSKGARDVVLFEFAMTAASPVNVRDTWLEIDGATGTDLLVGTGGTKYFTDIKLIDVDSSQVLAGPVSLPSTNGLQNSGTLGLSDDWLLEEGTRNLAITADIANTEDVGGELVGSTYTVTLGDNTADTTGPGAGAIFGSSDIKYSDSNDYVNVNDIVPNTPIVGNQQTARASSLSVNISNYISDNTHVKGVTDAASAAFVLTAGDDSDIRVRRFIVNPQADDDTNDTYLDMAAKNDVISAKLWQVTDSGWVELAGPKSVQDSNPGVGPVAGQETVTFDNFEITIPAGDSAVLVVSFNATTASLGGTPEDADQIVFTVQDSNYIEAYDEDDNQVTAVDNTGTVISAGNSNRVNEPNDEPLTDEVSSTLQLVGSFGLSSDQSASEYKTRLVRMGSTGQKALRVLAQASNEDFKVRDATIQVNGATNNAVAVAISYPTDKDQTTYETKSSVLVGGTASFTNMNWYVPADVDSYMSAMVNVQTDAQGASSGNNPFTLTLESQNADLGGSGLTRALGLSSGSFATTNNAGDADSAGNSLFARKTILTFDLNAASPQGVNKVPGLNDYLIFDVTNTEGNKSDINQLTFKISTSDGAGSDWGCAAGTPATIEIYDMDDLSTNLADDATITTTTVTGCTGAGSDIVETVVELDNDAGGGPGTPTPITVPADSSKSFKVKLNTIGASSANDDSISVSLISNDTAAAGGCTDSGGAGLCLEWTDGASTPSPIQNGYKVENLPVDGLGTSF